jgi:hypothetical protein
MMLDALKRLIGAGQSPAKGADQQQVLATWAKAEGHKLKTVSGQSGGVVVDTTAGWRIEWGPAQRPYFTGHELRFRFDAGVPADVQILFLTKVLAHSLETDVFQRFTDAMQTRVDNTLPEEMRWLAMHAKVPLSEHQVLHRRFLMLSNAEGIAKLWLDPEFAAALESAAASWWTDALVAVMTVNRGILTIRMSGDDIEVNQLRLVSALFDLAARKLVDAV